MPKLLDKKADIQATNNDGDTALPGAAECRHTGTMQMLLKRVADIQAINIAGDTTLQLAAGCGDTDTVLVLLNRSTAASIHAQSKSHLTALHNACSPAWSSFTSKRASVVKSLCDHGADIKDTTPQGDTCLHLVVKGCSAEVTAVKSLVEECGARDCVVVKNNMGQTPRNTAKTSMRQNSDQIADYFQQVEQEIGSIHGESCLFYCILDSCDMYM